MDDDNEIDRLSDYYQTVADERNLTTASWSIYEVTDLYEPHPYQGIQTVSYTTDQFWTGKADNHHTAPIAGPTWADLFTAADTLIRESGDLHHVFIEGFELSQDGTQLTLECGS